jgi:hypothetical protein
MLTDGAAKSALIKAGFLKASKPGRALRVAADKVVAARDSLGLGASPLISDEMFTDGTTKLALLKTEFVPKAFRPGRAFKAVADKPEAARGSLGFSASPLISEEMLTGGTTKLALLKTEFVPKGFKPGRAFKAVADKVEVARDSLGFVASPLISDEMFTDGATKLALLKTEFVPKAFKPGRAFKVVADKPAVARSSLGFSASSLISEEMLTDGTAKLALLKTEFVPKASKPRRVLKAVPLKP